MKKKIILPVVLIVALSLVALWGVYAVLGSVGQANAYTEDGRQIIYFGSWAGVEEAQGIQKILDELNPTLEDYYIVHQPQPADYYTKLQASMVGRSSSDLFWIDQNFFTQFADTGMLMDVTDCVKASDNPAANLDDYFPFILRTTMWDGKLYGLPWLAQPLILYYNKNLFDEAGLPYPDETWTWDTFLDVTEKLTKDIDGDGKNDQWGFTAETGWPPPEMFVWQAGGELVTPDLKEVPIDTPEAIRGWEFWQSWIYDDVHSVPEAIIGERGFSEMFKSGHVAMFMGGASDDFESIKDIRVGYSVVPKGPVNRDNLVWTATTTIPVFTKHPEYACDALIRLTDAFHHWKIVAPRYSLANAETIKQSVPAKAEGAEIIAEAAKETRAENIIPRQNEFDTIYDREFKYPLAHHQGTAAELAAKVRPRLESLLPDESK